LTAPIATPENVALLAPALTFIEIYLAPLPFSLTFVEIYLAPPPFSLTFIEIYLAPLAPPLTLANTYPAPLVPRPQCPTRQRRSTASPCRASAICIFMHPKPHKYAFSAPRPPFPKKRAANEKIPYHFFSNAAPAEEKAAPP